MNIQFKNQFKNLNSEEIKHIVNGCAGRDILELPINGNEMPSNSKTCYYIKYLDNDGYGFWVVQWGWKPICHKNMKLEGGFFEFGIKITPFKIEFENDKNSFNPFINTHNKKNLEEYLYIYINKKCPDYKKAVIEEVDKFIKFLDITTDKTETTKDDLCK